MIDIFPLDKAMIELLRKKQSFARSFLVFSDPQCQLSSQGLRKLPLDKKVPVPELSNALIDYLVNINALLGHIGAVIDTGVIFHAFKASWLDNP